MLELNNTRHTAFQRKDTKELDNGCHSHTSTAIDYIDLPINFVDGIIPMNTEQSLVSDIEVKTVCSEESNDTADSAFSDSEFEWTDTSLKETSQQDDWDFIQDIESNLVYEEEQEVTYLIL